MYLFKKDEKTNLLNGRTITYVASEIGITKEFLTSILNGKRACSRLVAYCVVKSLHSDAEIEDFFDLNKRGD